MVISITEFVPRKLIFKIIGTRCGVILGSKFDNRILGMYHLLAS